MPTPLATYRLQMHAGFGFDAAAAIADYLQELGVSHVYSSPYLQAGKGVRTATTSLNHSRVSDELGGPDAHARLCRTLGEHRLGQILDIVPNHMSIASRENAWWWDVLENGQSSRYATYFDVDWQPLEQKLHDTVLLPILGDHYGRVVDAGEIRLERTEGSFTFHYHEHVMPVAPRSLNDLVEHAALRADSADLAFIADSYANLPLSTATDSASIIRRHRDKEVLRAQLRRLCREQPEIAAALDQVVAETNASPSDIDTLLDRQNYRLAHWRTAGQELDYRRFFDINTLVSIRIEDERVFRDTHALVLDWIRRGILDGLRVDHPDGLRDPRSTSEGSARRSPRAGSSSRRSSSRANASRGLAGRGNHRLRLPQPAGRPFVDPAGEPRDQRFRDRFTGVSADYVAMVHEKSTWSCAALCQRYQSG